MSSDSKPINLVYLSQFRDSSGYAVAARGYLKALDAYIESTNANINLKVHTIVVETTNSLTREETALLEKYEFKSVSEVFETTEKEYVLLWHQPAPMITLADAYAKRDELWACAKLLIENADANVNVTVWEADKLPDVWVDKVYDRFDTNAVIVPSKWNHEVFSKCIGDRPCYLIPHTLDESVVCPTPFKMLEELEDKFVVFAMSQWQNRKGFDKLIQSFCMELGNTEDAVLVIKTYGVLMFGHSQTPEEQAQQIAQEVVRYKHSVYLESAKHPEVTILLIPNVVPYSEISAILERADLFALLTRGEGFGLPIAESLLHGTPVLVPDEGGHVDYIHPDAAFFVEGHWSPYVYKPEYTCDMNWYEPHLLSARAQFRDAYNLWKEGKLSKKGEIGREHFKTIGYDKISVGKKMVDVVREQSQALQPQGIGSLKVDTTLPINERIHFLKDQFTTYTHMRDRLDLLKDAFKGEECYILTCGPSLTEYKVANLKEKLKDKLVFTVKQAYDEYRDISDFHFFNSCNFTPFDCDEENPIISVGSSGETLPWTRINAWSDQEFDIFLQVMNDSRGINTSLAGTKQFEKWTLNNSVRRPWGPGIMYESVFYMAEHLGASTVYTVGWDFEAPGTTTSHHYYDEDVAPEGVKEKAGSQIIRPSDHMDAGEIAKKIEASQNLDRWLQSKDIDLFVATDASYVHKAVRRKKIQ